MDTLKFQVGLTDRSAWFEAGRVRRAIFEERDMPHHRHEADQASALYWGVKESFRNYVEGAGGQIEAAEGAARGVDGVFVFGGVSGGALTVDADGKLEGRLNFIGEVRMTAHGGMLSVSLADPDLEFSPSGASLAVVDRSLRTPRRVTFAQLDVTQMTTGDDGEIVIPAALSMDGCQVLGDHYPPSTPIDPVRLRLTAR